MKTGEEARWQPSDAVLRDVLRDDSPCNDLLVRPEGHLGTASQQRSLSPSLTQPYELGLQRSPACFLRNTQGHLRSDSLSASLAMGGQVWHIDLTSQCQGQPWEAQVPVSVLQASFLLVSDATSGYVM